MNSDPIERHTRRALALTFSLVVLASTGLTAARADSPAANYHLIKTISLPGGEGWDYLGIDSGAQRLYVSRSTHVAVIDIAAGAVVGDIPDTAGVHGIAVDVKGGRGFTSNGRANTVTVFDLKTLKRIIDIPVGDGPDCIVFDPFTRRVFTFNGRGKTATAIDAATDQVVGTVVLPGRPEFAVADGKGHLYNNIEDMSEIAEIDAATLSVLHTWPIAPGDSPSGIAMDQKGRRVFSVCDNQKMVVLNADTGAVAATPAIGNGPDAAAFDPKTHIVFSPNGEDGTMSLYKQSGPDNYELVQTLTTQPGARTMALDLKTHHVFTVTAQVAAGSPTTGRRRSYAPGSFVVLEYGP